MRFLRILYSLKVARTDRVGFKVFVSTRPVPAPLNTGHLDNILHWTRVYMNLSKFRLSLLVVSTAVSGYLIAPCTLGTGIIWTIAGTGLCAASANSLNQLFERSYDSEMSRTSNRMLVQGIISPLHAGCFSLSAGALGTAMLYFTLNELTACLGLFNIILYAFIYTPMKRFSIYNTWVGSAVGAIPPLMGWAAATGTLSAQAFVLSAILFAWQFPHIASLSWYTRSDYSKARYTMMSLKNPEMNFKVGLRYSLLMFPLCCTAPLLGVTTYWFVIDSLLPNVLLSWFGWRFYRERSNDSARKLFRVTLLHLPLIMMLLVIDKSQTNPHEAPYTYTTSADTALIIRNAQTENLT